MAIERKINGAVYPCEKAPAADGLKLFLRVVRLFRSVNTHSQKASVPVGFTDPTSGESGGCTNPIVSKELMQTRGNKVNGIEWQIDCPCWQHEIVRGAQGANG